MQFWKRFKKNLDKLDCYKSIDDLPIKRWFDIHLNNDFRWLLKEIVTIDSNDYDKLVELWKDIFNEFMDRFGLSEEFMAELDASVRLAELQADYIITGHKYLRTLIKIEEEKIKMNLTDLKEPADLEKALAKMSKYYGFKLSSRELTVSEYYSYLENITDGKKG